MTGLSAIPYFGGKSWNNTLGTCQWILGLLPPVEPNQCYIEPFAGMLGVLLNRQPVRTEIMNDMSDGIVAWWTAVRDHSDELARVLALTPYSRSEYERCLAGWRDDAVPVVERARRVTVVLLQSFLKTLAVSPGGWALGVVSPGPAARNWHSRISALSERMARVQIECRDAIDLLERVANDSRVVVYADPPYQGHENEYGMPMIDVDRMSGVLLAASARIAVSGYGADWDHLGWRRHEHATQSWAAIRRHAQSDSKPKSVDRVEVLWTNYAPAASTLFLMRVIDLFCGAGGAGLGLHRAGHETVLGVDHDRDAAATHAANLPGLVSAAFPAVFPAAELVWASPPCPEFSVVGSTPSGRGRSVALGVWSQVLRAAELADAVIVENVPPVVHHGRWHALGDSLAALGYRLSCEVLRSADFGVPQIRRRAFLVGVRGGVSFAWPAPSHVLGGGLSAAPWRTLEDAIGDLREWPVDGSAHPWHHRETSHRLAECMSHIPPGGNWRDAPRDLLPPRLAAAYGDTTNRQFEGSHYRRRWSDLATALTTKIDVDHPSAIHPDSDRLLTVLEWARLQGFPDDWHWHGSATAVTRQIGNAVPVLVGEALGRAFSF